MAYTPINWAEDLDVTAVKLDKMDSQINDNDSRITQIETFTAGTNYIYRDDTPVEGNNWEKVKGATIYKNGTIRVYFQFRFTGTGSFISYARIKKNGNVIQTYARTTTSFVTITRDLSISIGDTITLEVDNETTANTELRNFRLGINRESDLIVTT